MARKSRPVFWIRCRRIARKLRISVAVVCLLLVAVLFYLNLVGVPRFVERSVIQSLNRRGLDIQFSNLKLRFLQGLVAHDIQFGDPSEVNTLSALSEEIAIGIDWSDLLRLRVTPDALRIGDGFVRLPVGKEGNVYWLTLEDIAADLHFPLDESWEIRRLTARSSDIDISISGTLTNTWAVRDWFRFRENDQRDFRFVQRLLQVIEDAQFISTPTVDISLNGDAAEVNRLFGNVTMRVPHAVGKWGEIEGLQINVFANTRQLPEGLCNIALDASAARLGMTDGEIRSLQIGGNTQINLNDLSPEKIDFDFTSESMSFREFAAGAASFSVRSSSIEAFIAGEDRFATQLNGNADDVHFRDIIQAGEVRTSSHFRHPLREIDFSDLETLIAVTDLQLNAPRVGRTRIETLRATVEANPVESTQRVEPEEDWFWWRYFAPYELSADVRLGNLDASGIGIEEMGLRFDWLAPDVNVSRLFARMDGRDLEFQAGLDVDSRELSAGGSLDIDVKKFNDVLTGNAKERLGRLDWTTPPYVELEANLTLPVWTNTAPDWRNEVQPTMEVRGRFESQEVAFKTVPLLSARSSFAFTNRLWRIPDLVARRPEGTVHLDCIFDPWTKHYSLSITGESFIKPLKPLFGRNGETVVGSLEETAPASGNLVVYGPWNAGLGAVGGEVTIPSAFSYRGQNWDGGQAEFHYTNKFLQVYRGEFYREEGTATGSGITYSETNRLLTVSNGVSTVDPMVIARMIGTNTANMFRHYQFGNPPEVQVSGTLQFEDPPHPDADMMFKVAGGPFHYWKFNLPYVESRLHWHGSQLELSEMSGDFYGGKMIGYVSLDFENPEQIPLMFRLNATDADFEQFLVDFGGSTNEVDGIFDIEMGMSAPDAVDIDSWQGFGQAELRDGMIWDAPVIGIFSPLLNVLKDGLGNVRADRASATFELRDGKVITDDLYIRGPSFGLMYDGTIGLDKTLDAEAEAQIFRESGFFGDLIGLTLSPLTETFKYKVTGTLSEPKSTPLYIIPKILLIPVRPLKTLDELSDPVSDQNGSDVENDDDDQSSSDDPPR